MRKYTKTVGAVAAASALVAGYASAEIEGEVHVGYANSYEFRFVDVGSDLVEAGVDLSYEISEGFGVSAGAWYGTWDTSNLNQGVANFLGGPPVNQDELDLYAAVSKDLGPVSLELGYIYYYFPDGGGNTQEVYLAASVDLWWGLTAGSTYYYDFDANNGWYWNNEIGKSFVFNDCLSLDLAAGFAYSDGHDLQASNRFGSNGTKDGFQGWYIKAELPWEFRDGVTLAPYLKYTDADDDLVTDASLTRGTGALGGTDQVIAGVKLAVSF